MPISLKTILKKQDKSSRDIGLILMYYAKATLEDKEGDFPLTQAEISELAKKLIFRADKYKYDVLEAFYDAITTERLKAYDNARRIIGGINLLKLYIRSFDDHNRQDSYKYSLPLTLTSRGYYYYRQSAKIAALKKTYTFYDIFAHYLYSYLKLYIESPITIPNSILKGYADNTPIKTKSVKEYYKQVNFISSFQGEERPDGFILDDAEQVVDMLKSNEPTTAEERAYIEKSAELDKAYFYDDYETMQQLLRETKLWHEQVIPTSPDRIKTLAQNTSQMIEMGKVEIAILRLNRMTKLIPQEMPSDTTISDLLETALKKYEKPGHETDPTGLLFADDTRTPAKQLREIRAAAPELFEALCDQIRHDIPQFESLDAAELMKAAITGKDLEALNIGIMQRKFKDVNIRNFIINSKDTSYLEKRQATNGIAHISFSRESRDNHPINRITTEKIYNPDMPQPHTSLQEIISENTAAIYESEIYRPLKWIYAYNVFIDVCADLLKIPFMTCAEFKENAKISANISSFNRELFAAYRNIEGDDKTIAKREQIFKDKFKPIDPETAKTPQDMQTAITETLEAVLENKIGAQWISKAPQIIQEIADSKT